MSCKHEGVMTRFCPDCGVRLTATAGQSLLAYLRNQQAKCKREAEESRRDVRHSERRAHAALKWEHWALFVEEAISKLDGAK